MYFEPSFFQKEVRDNFTIMPMMKRAWAAQLEVLNQIDLICKRHNITWYAECGTLLGAVRHQGFIPWDDDLDIGMHRRDFNRFLHYANQELPEGYHLLCLQNGNFNELLARVVNSVMVSTEPTFLDRFHGCPYAVGVDIFICDNLPESREEEELQMDLLTLTFGCSKRWQENMLTEDEKSFYLQKIEEATGYHFDSSLSYERQLQALTNSICAMYWEDESEDIAIMGRVLLNRDFRFLGKWYSSIVYLPFEHLQLPVPAGYGEILAFRYGKDYRKPKQYKSHNYPFYADQQQQLFNAYKERGLDIPHCFLE